MNKRFFILIIIVVSAFVALTSSTILSNDSKDWCVEHTVPESECTKCDASLIEKFKSTGDWCGGHDIPESHCRLCNPEITFPQEEALSQNNAPLDWCVGHSVPESECTKCDESLIEHFKSTGDWCGGHDIPESHCRLCNPGITFPQEEILKTQKLETSGNAIEVSLFFRPNQNICATNDALIQFASSKTAERSGITTQQAIGAPYEVELDAPAEILFDENKTTVIASTVKALVSRWLVSPGDVVTLYDRIAILQSPEMAELQAKLISTYAELNLQEKELARANALVEKKLINESEYEHQVALFKKTQASYISERGLLLSTGITDFDIDKLLDDNIVSKEFTIRAPREGIIAKRIAQLGELLEDGQALAILTDPSSLWIEAHLTEAQMKNAYVGQDVSFASDDGVLHKVKGTVIWVSPFLDKHTRTGVVRAQVVSESHSLRAGSFGRMTISESSETQSVLVSKDAVQWEGCCNVVFVKESDNRFRPRKVELSDGPESFYHVTNGLFAGEEIVVGGSFLLKTELKKSSIGAGCCGIEPVE